MGIQLKIPGKDSGSVKNTGGGEALGVEPLLQMFAYGLGIVGAMFNPQRNFDQHRRGEPLSPVLQRFAGVVEGESLRRDGAAEQRDAGEFGMLLSLQQVALGTITNGTEEMVSAQALLVQPLSHQAVSKQRTLRSAVSTDGVLRVLARQKNHVARGRNFGKRTRVKLVYQGAAVGVLLHRTVSIR